MESQSAKHIPLRVSRTSIRRSSKQASSLIRDVLLWTGRAEKRVRRYVLTFGLPILALWGGVAAYAVFTPETYVSEMTLNLPGAASSSNISLQDIGQATTSSGNPFGSSTMSPKVIYKSLAEGPRVRGIAAKIVGNKSGMLAKPVIKLIDETAIMQFSMSGPTPEAARADAEAIQIALQQYLDVLRRDEVERRGNAIKDSLKDVSANLALARQRLLIFQKEHNIVSGDQFRSQIANAEVNRQKLIELNAERDRVRTESESLSELLGVSPEEATLALKVQADPRFTSLSSELAAALTEDSASRGKWGARHPKVIASSERLKAGQNALRRLAIKHGGELGGRVAEHLMLSDSKDRAELFRKMVEYRASSDGIDSQISSIENELQDNSSVLDNQNISAAALEDLERDHSIAEAVFSSALARVDTNRQDIYSSYPLLQILSEPSLASEPSSPKILFAGAGGIIGTFLILCALLLAWIRQPILRKILKSA